MKRVVSAYLDAFKAANIRPVQGHAATWDPAMILVDTLRKLGPSATAPQIRSAIAALHGWVGINGEYDFRKIPQRGVGMDAVFVARWDPEKGQMIGVSRAGGTLPGGRR